jgi:hypothetical protein
MLQIILTDGIPGYSKKDNHPSISNEHHAVSKKHNDTKLIIHIYSITSLCMKTPKLTC